ncbi:MAG: signal peptidase II [Kiritimatiellae bacterium]|nr:signal peptidase II [Kiritimatiellia bacterium]MDD4735000.1 signal peptidase II [Kiritimatiellia bacterium]
MSLFICLAIVVLDQVSKFFVREYLAFGSVRPVIPGLMNLTHLRNTGAAWGMLGNQNLFLSLLSFVMLILMVLFRRSFLNGGRVHRAAFGLLAGGIIGNLIDRIKQGAVTDFLDFYVANWHWPSFNVADAAICTGVGLYLLSSYLDAHGSHEPPHDE